MEILEKSGTPTDEEGEKHGKEKLWYTNEQLEQEVIYQNKRRNKMRISAEALREQYGFNRINFIWQQIRNAAANGQRSVIVSIHSEYMFIVELEKLGYEVEKEQGDDMEISW